MTRSSSAKTAVAELRAGPRLAGQPAAEEGVGVRIPRGSQDSWPGGGGASAGAASLHEKFPFFSHSFLLLEMVPRML